MPPKPTEATFVWVLRPPDGILTGTIYTDGSRLDGLVELLAVNGWAFVAVDGDGEPTAIARGIPPPWITDIAGAEAWAVLQAALRRAPDVPFRIDCEPCVMAIHRGMDWATNGKRKRRSYWDQGCRSLGFCFEPIGGNIPILFGERAGQGGRRIECVGHAE